MDTHCKVFWLSVSALFNDLSGFLLLVIIIIVSFASFLGVVFILFLFCLLKQLSVYQLGSLERCGAILVLVFCFRFLFFDFRLTKLAERASTFNLFGGSGFMFICQPRSTAFEQSLRPNVRDGEEEGGTRGNFYGLERSQYFYSKDPLERKIASLKAMKNLFFSCEFIAIVAQHYAIVFTCP